MARSDPYRGGRPAIGGPLSAGYKVPGDKKKPTAADFAAPSQGAGAYLYSSGNLKDPNRQMVADPTPEAAGVDWMGMFSKLMGMAGGGGGGMPAPNLGAFNSAPYDSALQNLQQQAAVGQEAIVRGGQDLMSRLGQLRQQYEGRNAQDVAAINATQQNALGQAQGAIAPVLADLQAQGVNPSGFSALANTRMGALGDQAALQNTLSQRLAQNTQGQLDATASSAALQGTGALNTLAGNLTAGAGQIGSAQAKAAQAHQQAQDAAMRSWLSAKNSGPSQLKQLGDVLGVMGKLGFGADDDDPMSEVAGMFEGDTESATGQALATALGQIQMGTRPETLIGQLNVKDEDGNDGWSALKDAGVDTEAYKSYLRKVGTPAKKKKNTLDLPTMMGMMG